MRSLLAVPATNARFLEKGAQSAADGVFIDLEDAVLPQLKVEARGKAIAALNDLDWGDRVVSVRVNDLGTPWGVRDIVELAEGAPRLDNILLPKCETAGDVHAAEAMLRAAEKSSRR
jgi:malyl-CoA/(S)-citramalyl-CoA lyase